MVKKLQALKAKKGFTLVELIVVIAIIGVLAAILVPTMMGMVTKARVTSVDSTASKLKDTVAEWMVGLDTSGGKVPSEATISIKGKTGAWTITGADSFKGPNSTAGSDILKTTLDDEYDFTKDITAVVYVDNRKAVACAYADSKDATLTAFTKEVLRSGKYAWNGKTDGVMTDGSIIGTYPKCIMAGADPAPEEPEE